jgi:hypothetical protein
MAIGPVSNLAFEPVDGQRISRRSTILIVFGVSAVLWLGVWWVISLI